MDTSKDPLQEPSQDRVGLFEQAHQGTLFLDEIGDISPGMQIKLLRVLQSREIMRVGESKTRKVDVRILAATNQNLTHEIEAGYFREDLYYRLRVIEIEIPPLRERVMDILPLARYFVNKFSEKTKSPQSSSRCDLSRTPSILWVAGKHSGT